jgi:predicted GIY-YIG superfamily endonuclease
MRKSRKKCGEPHLFCGRLATLYSKTAEHQGGAVMENGSGRTKSSVIWYIDFGDSKAALRASTRVCSIVREKYFVITGL